MNRTFKGFLKAYCTELAGVRTTNLRRLVALAQGNPRLVEPLFALAAVQGKLDYLQQIAAGSWFSGDYARVAKGLEGSDSLEEFLASAAAPKRYAAVLDAYRAQGDSLAADRRINGLLRPRIVAALDRAGVSRYRLCKDLGLNMGNAYAYLAGDDTKVARTTARRMLEYAEAAVE